MDLNAALKWLNATITDNTGHVLREPEIVILKGTWRGLTYDQMASSSDYSTNYLMRDVAPKLWKQLSSMFGRSVGKTNFRVALEAYAASKVTRSDFDALNFADSDALTSAMAKPSEGIAPDSIAYAQNAYRESPQLRAGGAGIYWHPTEAEAMGLGAPGALGTPAIDVRGFAHEAMYGGGGVRSTSTAVMYGYENELAQVAQWVSEALPIGSVLGQPTGQLVGIWGLRGIGKTLLVEKLVAQVGDRFAGVVWRSLSSQPTLNELSASILSDLGVRPLATGAIPSEGFAITQLLTLMAQKSLLIVLEGAEALLRSDALAGDYQVAHQDYSEFFQAATGSRSCIVVTGIEGPADLVRQGSYSRRQSVRSLTLSRLSEAAAIALLQAESLSAESVESPSAESPSVESLTADGSADSAQDLEPNQPPDQPSNQPPDQWLAQWPELIARYQAHPLALKSALRVIREIFNGRVDEFLKQRSVLFTDILRLLAPSFERLSRSEVNILYWLASQEAPLTLAELQQMPLPTSSATLISVLDSLKQRSLLEINTDAQSSTFYPPALVKAYAVHQFMGRFGEAYGGVESEGVESTPSQIIDLSPPIMSHVQLSAWFNRQFDADWQSLERLFEGSARPVMRLRNAYHLQAETFIKRCKSIQLAPSSSSGLLSSPSDKANTAAVLLVAIHQDAENLYKICVQAQPAKEANVLPENLALRLLDTQQNVLATVSAQQDDSFVQLPYFRGAMNESFAIELVLGECRHTESFVI